MKMKIMKKINNESNIMNVKYEINIERIISKMKIINEKEKWNENESKIKKERK